MSPNLFPSSPCFRGVYTGIAPQRGRPRPEPGIARTCNTHTHLSARYGAQKVALARPAPPPTRPFCKQMRAKPASGPNAFPMWSAPRRPTPCLACPGDDLTWCRPGSAGARQAGAGTPARSPFGQPVQLQWEHHTKHVHPHRASNCPTHRHRAPGPPCVLQSTGSTR